MHKSIRPLNVVALAVVVNLGACQMNVEAGPRPRDPGPAGKPAGTPSRAPAGNGQAGELAQSPMFWTWWEPLGRAANNPHIIKMVNVKTNKSPARVADEACNDILARRLGPGQVCILLHGFGMWDPDPNRPSWARTWPALWRHWCDGLQHTQRYGGPGSCERIGSTDAAEQWWMTTWMSNGIADCRVYMDAFIARYKQRQAQDPRIPDPSRFHFDSEARVSPAYSARGTVEAFNAMRRDPRWSTEPIPGHDGKTLAQLYQAAGEPKCDGSRSWGQSPNREWACWYGGVCFQATEGALNEAAYQPIREAWSGCLSSNYVTSAKFDGGGSPPRLTTGRREAWYKTSYKAFGDLQAPVCYWAAPEAKRPGETLEAASVRSAREKIEVNLRSSTGNGADIVPWVELTGSEKRSRGTEYKVPPDMMREMLQMLRSKGVREFIMWSGPSTQKTTEHWNEFMDAIESIWANEIRSMRLETGASMVGSIDRIRSAEGQTLRIKSKNSGVGREPNAAALRVRFNRAVDDAPRPRSLEIVADTWVDRGRGRATVSIYNWRTKEMDPIGSFDVSREQVSRSIVDPAPKHHVRSDGRIDLRIEHSGRRPFRAEIDRIQVIARDTKVEKPRRKRSRRGRIVRTGTSGDGP